MGWVHVEDRVVTSRKKYRCYLCGGIIDVKTRYLKRFGYSDGCAVIMKMHMECHNKTLDWDDMDWETFSPGELE
jgi:hypothetical protein